MASLRSLAISLLRLDGHVNIAPANRHHAPDSNGRSSCFSRMNDFAGSLAAGRCGCCTLLLHFLNRR
jgi:hypothetical protein